MWLTRVCLNNPVLATMMMVAMVVLGLFSYQRLKVDQFPDINFPIVVVSTDYPGASPESVESDVSRKVEEAVNSVSGIKNLTSRSYEGTSVVIIEFELTVDPAQAVNDVREKVSAIRPNFRREVKDPRISRFDPSDRPVISLAVNSTANRSLRELTTLADQMVKKRMENVRGVGSVSLVGGVKREIQVQLNPAQMEALSVGVDQIINALRNENIELPAGTLKSAQSERVVQIEGRLKSPAEFERIIVARRGGQPVYLSQVAKVIDGQEELDSVALIDGQRTLALDIRKAQGENTIAVAQEVREAISSLAKRLPPDVQVSVVKDSSIGIKLSVDNVKRTMVEGAVLTILIVFLFLTSWRSTVITGLTLPIALIGTFLFMYALGFSINTLTLLALSLCVGLLIDDAIVVRENIVRHAQMGKDHKQAAFDGTQEIGLAVVATTLSIVAVFLPVGFMGGIIGRFFHQFGITVAVAVLISMFVSFTLDPMLSSIWPDPAAHGQFPRGPLGWVLKKFDRFNTWLAHQYEAALAWSLAWRKATLAIAAGLFLLSFPLMKFLGSEFVPTSDLNETLVRFYTPVGSSLAATEAKSRQVEEVIRAFPEVTKTFVTINTGTVQGRNYAEVYIKLKPRKERSMSQAQLQVPLRERLQRINGITVTHVGTLNSVGGSKTVQFSVLGPDLKQLERYTEQIKERIKPIPGLVDVDTSSKAAKPTVAIQIKRDVASDLGVGVAQIGSALRPLVAGEAATTWRGPDDENYDVKVQLAPESRHSLADLEQLSLTSAQVLPDGQPKMVALRQVATLTPAVGPTQINRRELMREIQIDANVSGRSAGEVSTDVRKAIADLPLQPGYRISIGGSDKDMRESAGFAASALVLAIIFIYMILASQFKSFMQPLAIMASLPLTLIGVVGALMLFRSTLNLFSIIGFIMLMGLVTKNAILLIDFVNQAREQGVARTQAILQAAHVRLRPILMTTLAMVFGMIPLALALTEGSEQRAPMGQAVIGGIITSSVLTLVVVPVIYTYLDDLVQWLKQGKNKGVNPTNSPDSGPGGPESVLHSPIKMRGSAAAPHQD